MIASPSPAGRTVPLASTVAIAGFEEVNSALLVRSLTTRPLSLVRRMRRWLALGPVNTVSDGSSLRSAAWLLDTEDQESQNRKSVVTRNMMGSLKQFLDRLHAVIREWNRPALRPGELAMN